MDFYIQSLGYKFWNITNASDINYSTICDYLRKNFTVDMLKSNDIEAQMKFFENVKDQSTMVSGFDVRAVIEEQNKTRYCDNSCDGNFKYICYTIPVHEYQRKWKEVALLNKLQILQVRIRWTKTEYYDNYDANSIPPYPYFNVDEDQLIEYPGYVYHCHFLDHEDDELMRPFMMQPSDRFSKEFQPNQHLSQCMNKTDPNNTRGWKSRYDCINNNIHSKRKQ